MGEVQGSLWTTMLFVVCFLGLAVMLFWGIDIMRYNSQIYTIEDNLRGDNQEIFKDLPASFNSCPVAYDTTTNCSGLIEVNEDEGYIKYQISYNGIIMNVDASTGDDQIVIMPY